MVSALDGDKLTDEELVTMAALLLAAGFETTTGLLSNGLVALLAFPAQAALLRDSPSPELAASATEELLRFDAPGSCCSAGSPTRTWRWPGCG